MTLTGLAALVVFGVITSVLLKRFMNRFVMVPWRLFFLLAYNGLYGVAYIDLLKTRTVWGWPVSKNVYEYVELVVALCIGLLVFHVWCVVSVRGSEERSRL